MMLSWCSSSDGLARCSMAMALLLLLLLLLLLSPSDEEEEEEATDGETDNAERKICLAGVFTNTATSHTVRSASNVCAENVADSFAMGLWKWCRRTPISQRNPFSALVRRGSGSNGSNGSMSEIGMKNGLSAVFHPFCAEAVEEDDEVDEDEEDRDDDEDETDSDDEATSAEDAPEDMNTAIALLSAADFLFSPIMLRSALCRTSALCVTTRAPRIMLTGAESSAIFSRRLRKEATMAAGTRGEAR